MVDIQNLSELELLTQNLVNLSKKFKEDKLSATVNILSLVVSDLVKKKNSIHHIYNLPEVIISNILIYSDYKTLYNLNIVSKFFNRSRNNIKSPVRQAVDSIVKNRKPKRNYFYAVINHPDFLDHELKSTPDMLIKLDNPVKRY